MARLRASKPLPKVRREQVRGIGWEDGPRVWLLCGGLRREGDQDDVHKSCCAVYAKSGIGPTERDLTRLAAEAPYRRAYKFTRTTAQVMERGLAAARSAPETEVIYETTDGEQKHRFSLWCSREGTLEELTCVVRLSDPIADVRLAPQQLEVLISRFLEGDSEAALEFPWRAPRQIDPQLDYCFRRLIER